VAATNEVALNLTLNDKQFRKFLKSLEKDVEKTAKKMGASIGASFAGLTAAFKFIEKGGKMVVRTIEDIFRASVKLAKVAMPKEFDRLVATADKLGKSIAQAASHSGALQSGLNALTTAATSLINLFSSESGQKIINAFFQKFNLLAADAIDALLGAYKLVQSIKGPKDKGDDLVDSAAAGVLGSSSNNPLLRFLLSSALDPGPRRRLVRTSLDKPSAEEQALLAAENLANDLRAGKSAGLIKSQGIRQDPTKPQNRAGVVADGDFASSLFGLFGLGALPEIAGFSQERLRIAGLQEGLNQRTRGAATEKADPLGLKSRELVDALNESVTAIVDFQKPARDGLIGLNDVFIEGLTEITDQSRPILEQMRDTFASSFTDLFTNIAEGIGTGTLDILGEIGSFLGSILKQIGTMLIQLGAAGLAAATLGTFIPFLAPVTGGPAGIGASLAAIATGGVLVGVGSALGGISGGGGAAPTSAARRGSPGRSNFGGGGTSGIPQSGVSSGRGVPEQNVFNINFHEPVFGANSEERMAIFIGNAINRQRRRSRPGGN
jgi:hypothetical protein